MSKKTDCVFTVKYKESQIKEFLKETNLNSGSRLKPIGVDQLIHLEKSIGDVTDPPISEIGKDIGRIIWKIQPEELEIYRPEICYIRLVCLSSNRVHFPSENYWKSAITKRSLKSKYGHISPDGCLFLLPRDNNKVRLSLQKKVKDPIDIFVGYQILFRLIDIENPDKFSFCSIDPFMRIHPRSKDDNDA